MTEQDEPVTKIDKTMSIVTANLWGNLLAVPVFVVFGGAYIWRWGLPADGLTFGWFELIAAVVIFIVSIVLHELLHGLGYYLGGATWSQIKYGVKQLTPYAHCEIPLSLNAYRLAVILPGFILGVMPAVVGILSGSGVLTLYGTIMTAAALGDALILWLLRDAPPAAKVQDHPSKVGCELLI